jgi:hypothetical protein
MGGFITKTEIESEKDFILDTYGQDVYNACMEAEENETFLGILIKLEKI